MTLAAHELELTVDRKPLLRGVSFSLSAGEGLRIEGPSGIGKSTLLRIVATLDSPERGQMTLDGRTPADWGYPHYRARVLLCRQEPVLHAGTVRENLRRPFRFMAPRGSYKEDEASQALEALGLSTSVLDQSAGALSVGERQRVCLVRAVLTGPAWLLLDEPTSALDPESVQQTESFLLDWRARTGGGWLLVSHDGEQGKRLCANSLQLGSFRV